MTTTHHHNIDAKLGEDAVVIAGITAVVANLVSEAGSFSVIDEGVAMFIKPFKVSYLC